MEEVKPNIKIYSVSQFNQGLKGMFDTTPGFAFLGIKGEISNLKMHNSGHMYLSLKDDKAVMSAVMYKWDVPNGLNCVPKDGMKVTAYGKISIYPEGGRYQLYIKAMEEDGLGELMIAYEKLKKQLEEEGLFAEEHKKPIPKFPRKIGVCTAPDGAAVRDIINVISRRFPFAEIIIKPTQVQGKAAAPSIIEGITLFNKMSEVDTIIIGRGGGSIEDLWAFNEEAVARCIYDSKIPIISAVGHETDFTISDFVADLRAPTPSAAAELAVPDSARVISEFGAKSELLQMKMMAIVERHRAKLSALKLPHPGDRILNNIQKLDAIYDKMTQVVRQIYLAKDAGFKQQVAKLDAFSPLKVLGRGYAIPTNDDGKVIRSVKDLSGEFDLRMNDGIARCAKV